MIRLWKSKDWQKHLLFERRLFVSMTFLERCVKLITYVRVHFFMMSIRGKWGFNECVGAIRWRRVILGILGCSCWGKFFSLKFSCPQRCYLFYQEYKLSIVVFCHQTCRKILEGDSSMHLSLCIPWTMWHHLRPLKKPCTILDMIWGLIVPLFSLPTKSTSCETGK